jgi:hypothetical protein
MTDTPSSQPSPQAASPQADDGTEHTETETHGWTIDVPDHPGRQDSPEYVAARRQMNEIAGQATGLIYGPGPFQDHHGGALWLKDAQGWFMVRNCAGIEWSAQFCLDGKVKVLTADLRWIPIGDVAVGQTLLGFDEESRPGLWRRWQPAEVLASRIIDRPCYDLVFDDGTKIRASAEHRWLVSRGATTSPRSYHSTAGWVTTEDLSVARGWTPEQDAELRRLYQADVPATEIADRLSRTVSGVQSRASRLGLRKRNRHRREGYVTPSRADVPVERGNWGASSVLKLVDVWDEDTSRGGGYLAAAFDGEGWLTQSEDEGRGPGFGTAVRLGFGQRGNAMLDEVQKFLEERGFDYLMQYGSDDLYRLMIRGRAEIMRFLGSVRPQRLLAGFQPATLGTMQRIGVATLVQKEFVGNQPVVALTTSTGTFVAEGLASHNCADPAKVDLLRQNAKRLYDLLAPEIKQELDPDGLLDTPITDADGIAKWTDSIFNAGVPLHPAFHTGVLPAGGVQNAAAADPEPGGVHHYPTPIADIQLFKRDDFQLWVADGQGNPAAVAPLAPRGSGDGRVHVLYATPGSQLAAQKHTAEQAGQPLILGASHPLALQAFQNQ